MRRWIRPLLGLAVTVFFTWLMLNRVEFAEVGAALSRISVVSLAMALAFLAADYAIRIVRWWWMLRALDPRVALGACGWPFLVSIAVNNLVPFRVGDALRVVGFHKELKVPAMSVLGTLFVERLLDLMTLLAFFFWGLSGINDGTVPSTLIRLASWIAAGSVLAVLAVLLLSRQIERVVNFVADRPFLIARGWSSPIKRHSNNFLETLRLLLTPALTLRLIGLSIVVWMLEGGVFAIVAHTLSPESTASAPWFAMATGTLATLIPSSPGYVGTFDYFTVLGLKAYGAQPSAAAAFAFTVHAVLWLPLTVTGVVYFLRPGAALLRRQAAAVISSEKESV